MKVHSICKVLLKIIATPALLFVALLFIWLGMIEGVVTWWEFILLLAFKFWMVAIGIGFFSLIILLWDPAAFHQRDGDKHCT